MIDHGKSANGEPQGLGGKAKAYVPVNAILKEHLNPKRKVHASTHAGPSDGECCLTTCRRQIINGSGKLGSEVPSGSAPVGKCFVLDYWKLFPTKVQTLTRGVL